MNPDEHCDAPSDSKGGLQVTLLGTFARAAIETPLHIARKHVSAPIRGQTVRERMFADRCIPKVSHRHAAQPLPS